MSAMSDRDAGQVRLAIEEWLIDNRWPDAYDLSHAIVASDWFRDALTARQSDPDATERVEWGVRGPEGLGDDRMVIQGRDEVETRTAFATYWAFSGGTLVRRTVTTGEWEVAE